MPRSCPSCGAEALGNGTLCAICGIALGLISVDPAAADGEQATKSSVPGDPAASAPADPFPVANADPPDSPACFHFHIPVRYLVDGVGVILAVLVSVAVTTIDLPLPTVFPAGQPRTTGPAMPASPVAAAPVVQAPAVIEFPKEDVHHAARPGKRAKPAKPSRPDVVPIKTPAKKPVPAAPLRSSIDEKYSRIVRNECRGGILGFPCREIVRWRLCSGRWNHGDNPHETRCSVALQDWSDRRFSPV